MIVGSGLYFNGYEESVPAEYVVRNTCLCKRPAPRRHSHVTWKEDVESPAGLSTPLLNFALRCHSFREYEH